MTFFAGSRPRRREGRNAARFHAALFARQEARGGALRSPPSLVRRGRRTRHVSKTGFANYFEQSLSNF